MSEPFIGEIQMFGFYFNPRNWAYCNGATLPISQNTALFALIGTIYGGNGTTTFQLPNFAARAGCEQGQSPGLSERVLGETFGVNTVTLISTEIPVHNHGVNAFAQSDRAKKSDTPGNNSALSTLGSNTARPFNDASPSTTFAPNMISPNQGGGFPHENQQPYLGVNFCIALQGVFPSFP